jgi:hypothetical protein
MRQWFGAAAVRWLGHPLLGTNTQGPKGSAIERMQREVGINARWAGPSDVCAKYWEAYCFPIPVALLEDQQIFLACRTRNTVYHHEFSRLPIAVPNGIDTYVNR